MRRMGGGSGGGGAPAPPPPHNGVKGHCCGGYVAGDSVSGRSCGTGTTPLRGRDLVAGGQRAIAGFRAQPQR
jgi:hypothetical protein